MKRFTAVVLLLTLLISLCGCGEQNTVLGYVRVCAQGLESSWKNPEVYVMKYTSRRALSDEVLDTELYDEIPTRGYAILFHSYVSGDPFADSYGFFLDMDGNIQCTIDYEESDKLFDKYYSSFSPYNTAAGEMAVMHLKNCNYLSGMINYAGEHCEELTSKLQENVWYSLSEKLIDKLH